MRGLNTNIVVAIKGKYARSVHNLLAYALKEERKIKEFQQENISKCINLCKDIATRLHAELKPKVSFVVGSKQASTPCKNKRSIVTIINGC
jgi:galactose-1-phosphate uridylyltransferase